MPAAETLLVEVAYATPERQILLSLTVPAGSTVEQAIAASGLCERHPEVRMDHCRIGIFGRLTTPAQRLCEGDRIEIYRPLQIDPKAARRARAEATRRAGH